MRGQHGSVRALLHAAESAVAVDASTYALAMSAFSGDPLLLAKVQHQGSGPRVEGDMCNVPIASSLYAGIHIQYIYIYTLLYNTYTAAFR